MQDPSQKVIYNLESLLPGQLYTAPVSIETAITEWLINIESLHNTNSLQLPGQITLHLHDCPKVDFELSYDKGAKPRPIMCLFSTPESGTWTGCLFTTADETPRWEKMAQRVGLKEFVYKRLFAHTRNSAEVGFAGFVVKALHFPDEAGPTYLGFNGREEDPASYMLCLPVRLPFPLNGKLNLLLPRPMEDNRNALKGGAPYPCPSFIVSAASYQKILVQALKSEMYLGTAIKRKLEMEGKRVQDFEAEGGGGTLEENIQMEEDYMKRVEAEEGEEVKNDMGRKRKRHLEQKNGDENKPSKKRKSKGGPGSRIPSGSL